MDCIWGAVVSSLHCPIAAATTAAAGARSVPIAGAEVAAERIHIGKTDCSPPSFLLAQVPLSLPLFLSLRESCPTTTSVMSNSTDPSSPSFDTSQCAFLRALYYSQHEVTVVAYGSCSPRTGDYVLPLWLCSFGDRLPDSDCSIRPFHRFAHVLRRFAAQADSLKHSCARR
jgi:hypothetical protein